MEDNKKSVFSTWLEQLQQESWHLELLISGFALIGLFHADERLTDLLYNIVANQGYSSDMPKGMAVSFLRTGLWIFIVNLVVHLVIRGLWIGAIGLRYFSGDIEYEEIKFSRRFREHYRNKVGSFDKYIERLENISSVIFSYTFLLVFVFASAMIFFLELFGTILIIQWLSGGEQRDFNLSTPNDSLGPWVGVPLILLLGLVLILAIVVMLDFVFLSPLKKVKQRHFSYLYLGVSRFFGWITLSFIWRPLYLNFLDRKETRFLLMLIVPYLVVFMGVSDSKPLRYEYFPNMKNIDLTINHQKSSEARHSIVKRFYKEYWQSHEIDGTISILCLENKRLSGSIGEVFLKYDIEMEELVFHSELNALNEAKNGIPIISGFIDGFNSAKEEHEYADSTRSVGIVVGGTVKGTKGGEQAISNVKDKIMDYFWLSIDDQRLPDDCVDCNFYVHENAGEKGLLCHFRIDSLDIGLHHLTYDKVRVSPLSGKTITFDTSSISIPFIYEGL